MMTRQQIHWAKQHDWFLRETTDGNGVVVRHDMDPNDVLTFRDYQELREWAGY